VNVESAFNKEGSFFGGSGGGAKLADQSKKVSEVKKEIMKANNEVASRKKMLQYRLQRMDAKVKPETGAPSEVDRFSSGGKSNGTNVLDSALKHPIDTAKEVFNIKGLNKFAEPISLKKSSSPIGGRSKPFTPKQVAKKTAFVKEQQRYDKYMPDEAMVAGKVRQNPGKYDYGATEKYYAKKIHIQKPWLGSGSKPWMRGNQHVA
jgi:hypothetical protein